jgi:predicted house-cleaning noncanonical NTP pyrophosphatase (MazG superfamily)
MKPKKLVREEMINIIPKGEYERIDNQNELNDLYALKVKEELREIQNSNHQDIKEFADLIDVSMAFAIENGFTLEQLHEVSAIKEEKKGVYTNLALNNLNPSNPSNALYFEVKDQYSEFKSIKVPISSLEYSINSVGCLRYITMNGPLEQSSVIVPDEMGIFLSNVSHQIAGFTFIGTDKYVLIKNK